MQHLSVPVTAFAQNCSLVWCEKSRRGALVDPGGEPQRILAAVAEAGVTVERILLTHGHLDHILGLGGLASTFGRWEAIEEMAIWGGAGALGRVRELMRVVFGAGEANIRIAYRTVTPGVLQDDELFRLRAFPVEHRRTEAFGYSFEEKPRRCSTGNARSRNNSSSCSTHGVTAVSYTHLTLPTTILV